MLNENSFLLLFVGISLVPFISSLIELTKISPNHVALKSTSATPFTELALKNFNVGFNTIFFEYLSKANIYIYVSKNSGLNYFQMSVERNCKVPILFSTTLSEKLNHGYYFEN